MPRVPSFLRTSANASRAVVLAAGLLGVALLPSPWGRFEWWAWRPELRADLASGLLSGSVIGYALSQAEAVRQQHERERAETMRQAELDAIHALSRRLSLRIFRDALVVLGRLLDSTWSALLDDKFVKVDGGQQLLFDAVGAYWSAEEIAVLRKALSRRVNSLQDLSRKQDVMAAITVAMLANDVVEGAQEQLDVTSWLERHWRFASERMRQPQAEISELAHVLLIHGAATHAETLLQYRDRLSRLFADRLFSSTIPFHIAKTVCEEAFSEPLDTLQLRLAVPDGWTRRPERAIWLDNQTKPSQR